MKIFTKGGRRSGETIDDVVDDYRLDGSPEYETDRIASILCALAKSLPPDSQRMLAEELGWTEVHLPDSRER